MKYQRAKAGFIRYPDGKLLVAAGRILQCMKNSTTFTDPRPSLAEIETAFEDYQQKVYAAAGGGIFYSTAKRESKRRLSDLLQKLALYVNVVSDGHLPTLHSSGFPVLDRRRKGRSPDTPGQPFLRDGRKQGEVAFGFKPVGRDMFYDYCFATAADNRGNPIWGELRTTTRSWTDYADGFTPGSEVYFRVRARNKHGASNWTEPIRRFIR
ncbi:fibronectin type III domain-containing protein [Parapedobacter sp.]